jgi:hypothetical protein
VIALGGNVDGYKSALRLYLSYNIITEYVCFSLILRLRKSHS